MWYQVLPGCHYPGGLISAFRGESFLPTPDRAGQKRASMRQATLHGHKTTSTGDFVPHIMLRVLELRFLAMMCGWHFGC